MKLKWSESTPFQRNYLVAEYVMKQNIRCTGKLKQTERDILRSRTDYECLECDTKLTVTDFYREALPLPTEHLKTVPAYSQSMDAVWLVLQQMESIEFEELQSPFAYHLGVMFATPDGFDTFRISLEQLVRLTPEKICFAALKAVGVEIEP